MSKHLAKHVSGRKSRNEIPEEPSYYEPEEFELDEPEEEEYAEEEYAEEEPVYEDEEYYEEDYETARAGKKKKGRKLLVAIIVIVAFVIILAELAYLAFGYFYNKMNYTGALTQEQRAAAIASFVDVPEEAEEDPNAVVVSDTEVTGIQAEIQAQLAASGGSLMSRADVINILLIGTDARELDESARSDVMMLASLNKNTHKIVLTSFMRDVYTYIPDYGYNRLNAAYAIAGADYLIETLETDFGIDIDNYAAVNFYAFADVIDAVGGIDLELTKAEVDFINEQAYDGEQAQLGVGTGAVYLEYSEGGRYHLNGTQALAHCRNRSSAGSDFDRTSRQRTVISTMLEKAKRATLTELYNLVDKILPMISTDLTQGDCLSLLIKSPEYLGYEIESLRVPYENNYTSAMINGMAVLSIDFAETSRVLQDAIYGSPESTAAPAPADAAVGAAAEPADAAPPAPLAEETAPPQEATPAPTTPLSELVVTKLYEDIFEKYADGVGSTLIADFQSEADFEGYEVEVTEGNDQDHWTYVIKDADGNSVTIAFYPNNEEEGPENWIESITRVTYSKTIKRVSVTDNNHKRTAPKYRTWDELNKNQTVESMDDLKRFMFDD